MIVYVVTIPWDSASVGNTYVFKDKDRAERFCAYFNEKGYNGYCNGLSVAECEVRIGKERKHETK